MSCLISGAQKRRFYSSHLCNSLQVNVLLFQFTLYSIKHVFRPKSGRIFTTATVNKAATVNKSEFIVICCVIFLLYLDDVTLL